MVRKPGKLPGLTISEKYDLEYGSNAVELQPDLIKKDSRVVMLDDLMATGGTMIAGINLVRKAGGNVVAAVSLIELEGLPGRKKVESLKCPVESLLLLPADVPRT
jgi:adenine phosphoribosyltransferase